MSRRAKAKAKDIADSGLDSQTKDAQPPNPYAPPFTPTQESDELNQRSMPDQVNSENEEISSSSEQEEEEDPPNEGDAPVSMAQFSSVLTQIMKHQEKRDKAREKREEARDKRERDRRKAETQRLKQMDEELKLYRDEAAAREIAHDKVNAAVKVPKMERLTKVEEMHSFLATFAKQMKRCDIPKDKWMAHIIPILDDKSRRFQERMPDDQQEDFDALQTGLLKLHGLGRAFYRQKWEEMSKAKEDTHLQAFQKLEQLEEAWCRIEPDVRAVRLRDKFLQMLDPEERAYVLSADPTTGSEAVQLVTNYRIGHPLSSHTIREQDATPANQRPSREGADYSARRSFRDPKPKPEAAGPRKITPIPKDLEGTSVWRGDVALCFNCRQWGHVQRHCPKRTETKECLAIMTDRPDSPTNFDRYQGRINGQSANNIAIDSLCSLSQVHPKWISSATPTKGWANVQGANNIVK